MVKVIHFDDSGSETGQIYLDDFTVEILYSGIAKLLHDAVATQGPAAARNEVSKEARQRRDRILARING
jgi:hypothetical protein